jgi:hypothetical protein
MTARDRVCVLLKNVFDPLEIKQARAIDEVVQIAHAHSRLGFQRTIGAQRGLAHKIYMTFIWVLGVADLFD